MTHRLLDKRDFSPKSNYLFRIDKLFIEDKKYSFTEILHDTDKSRKK
ncbi:MAG: hypothetical protein CM15mP108_2970 [Gammaproteobacteria bacterium]|nr:MAG: hypothetical protein CM15mP108_2970 [Gammaproteobacteria bacterium]